MSQVDKWTLLSFTYICHASACIMYMYIHMYSVDNVYDIRIHTVVANTDYYHYDR